MPDWVGPAGPLGFVPLGAGAGTGDGGSEASPMGAEAFTPMQTALLSLSCRFAKSASLQLDASHGFHVPNCAALIEKSPVNVSQL